MLWLETAYLNNTDLKIDMYKLLTSKGQIFAVILGLISVLIAIGSIVSGVKSNYTMSDDLNRIMKDNADATFDFFNPAISIVMILVLLALFLAIASAVMGFFTDPKGSIKFLLALAGMAILFVILYASSSAEGGARLVMLSEKFNISDGVSKLISGGVKTTVVAILIAAVGALIMEVINFFK